MPSLIQKLKVFFLPNVSHVKGPWKHKKNTKESAQTQIERRWETETTIVEKEEREEGEKEVRRRNRREDEDKDEDEGHDWWFVLGC